VERKFPYCDYDYVGTKEGWNLGFCEGNFEKEEMDVSDIPFSSQHPPVVLRRDMAPVAWDMLEGYDDVCDKVPAGRRAIGEKRNVELWPYGCAKLRMTELPLI
jgi:hypothetical protein